MPYPKNAFSPAKSQMGFQKGKKNENCSENEYNDNFPQIKDQKITWKNA